MLGTIIGYIILEIKSFRGESVKKKTGIEITSMVLHLMAMAFMLCDHLWGTVIPGNDWLTCIGRMAFPIFAFLLMEGYFHTGNLKKYALRLFLFALLSEIPFNLAMGSRLFYPVHQNVLWSFLISLGLVHWNEKVKKSGKLWLRILAGVVSILLGYVVGLLSMVDFYHAGILTVLVFYFFRRKKWWSCFAQLLCLWYLNMEMLGGFAYELQFFGRTWYLVRQGFALLALVPIWLYRGKQGYHSRWLQMAYYAFYPLHLLILGLIKVL